MRMIIDIALIRAIRDKEFKGVMNYAEVIDWLRETHGLHIMILPEWSDNVIHDTAPDKWIFTYVDLKNPPFSIHIDKNILFNRWEDAAKAAIDLLVKKL